MAWTTVETPNAKYVLVFSPHIVKPTIPSEFDAVILENTLFANPKEQVSQPADARIVSAAVNQGKDVWITDASPKLRSYLRTVGGIAALYLLLPNTLVVFSSLALIGTLGSARKVKIKREKFWGLFSRVANSVAGKGLTTLRDSLTVEKAESFIAPRLQKQLGKKPVIAMSFGTGHFGIIRMLKNPKRRMELLGKYNLDKYLRKPQKALHIKFDANGNIKELNEFNETMPAIKKRKKATKTKSCKRRFGRGKHL